MKDWKDILTCIIGYPLRILALAAAPYGAYCLLLYRWDFGKPLAIVAAIACGIIVFSDFLSAHDKRENK